MPEVTLTGHIVVPSADLDAVKAELPTHAQLTRAEPGCIEFNVTQDESDPTIFHLSERFDSPEAFTQHQQRVKTSKWSSVAANIERHFTITGLD